MTLTFLLFSRRYKDKKKTGIYYTLSPLFWSKKDCSVKIDSNFESIFDMLSDGVNQNYISLFFHAKNWNKHVKNTQKSRFFFIFRGWNWKNFKTKFKWSIAFLKSFQMPFSDFENVACIKRYRGKTIKMVPSLSHLYFKNDWIDQSENLIPKFYEQDLNFISDNFFRYLW